MISGRGKCSCKFATTAVFVFTEVTGALASFGFLKDVPAWALPGGKERPSLVGTFGWLQGGLVRFLPLVNLLVLLNVPGLDGPGGKPIQAAGDILPIQARNFFISSPVLTGFGFRCTSEFD